MTPAQTSWELEQIGVICMRTGLLCASDISVLWDAHHTRTEQANNATLKTPLPVEILTTNLKEMSEF